MTSLNLLRTTDTSQWSPASPDPDGITYIDTSDTLLVADSEVNEIPALFTGDNLFQIDLNGNLVTGGLLESNESTESTLPYSQEPSGSDFFDNVLYFADDDRRRIFKVDLGSDGLYGTSDDTLTSFSTSSFGTDPEGVVYAEDLGTLFILDGITNRVVQVTTDGTFISEFWTFTNPTTADLEDPEGIEYYNGRLYVVGQPANNLYVFETDGTFVEKLDISAANAVKPAGLAIAPSSDGNGLSIFITDRGIDNNEDPNENDGLIYEFRLQEGVVNTAPTVDAGVDQSVETLQVSLDATITDDGLPNGTLTSTWSLVSGPPGTVVFGDPNAEDTTATFSTFGTYTLQLEATDGEFTRTDLVEITATDPNQNQAPVVNAGVDQTLSGLQASLDATITDDGLPSGSVNSTWSLISGPGTATFGDPNAEDTTVSFSDFGTYVLQLEADDGNLSTTDQVEIELRDPSQQNLVYISPDSGGTVGGVAYDDEDILLYDLNTDTWSMYFDGSDVGLDSVSTEAFYIQPNGSILLSFNTSVTLPGIGGTVQDHDIVQFTPTSTGTNTAGTWSLYFDGSDVGLSSSNDDIRAIGFAPDGRLLISTKGGPSFLATAEDEDLLAFNAASLGTNTAGTWEVYFDGSTADLGEEDIDGAWVDTNEDIYISTDGNYSVTGLSGDGNDILRFVPSSLGEGTTSGSYSIYWDGNTYGFTGEVAGFQVVAGTAENRAPLVNAGDDQSIKTFATSLDALVSDDGLPSGSSVTTTWSLVSGPGTATFDDPNAEDTSVTFEDDVFGTYVLQLEASDGELTTTDQVEIVIANDAPVVEAGANQFITTLSTALDSTITDDGLPSGSITSTWSLVSGPGAATFGDPNVEDTTVSFSEFGTYVLQLEASDGDRTTIDEVTVTAQEAGQQSFIYVALGGSGTLGTVAYDEQDILRFDVASNTWSMYFDGSDVISDDVKVEAFHLQDDGSILLSFNSNASSLPGIAGTVQDHDIVRFAPTSTGDTTAGTFSLYFDGTLAGLSTAADDIRAIGFTADDRLLVSTKANPSFLTGAGDEDLLVFNGDPSNPAAGTWDIFFDGSSTGFGQDIDGSWIDRSNGEIYLSNDGAFTALGISGDGNDIFTYNPSTGNFSSFWDGDAFGVPSGQELTGLHIA